MATRPWVGKPLDLDASTGTLTNCNEAIQNKSKLTGVSEAINDTILVMKID